MNYEEIVETRNGNLQHQEKVLYGMFYKKLVDKKYQNVIDIRQDLMDSILFAEGLRRECEANKELTDPRQLHFVANEDSSGIYGLRLEQGNYQTFSQLLEENPAVVASKDFVDVTVRDLLESAAWLHGQGIFHVCYAPSNVFARKGDGAVRLALHGSFYQAMNSSRLLYEGYEDFVAPEVLEGEQPDVRSDIYSIGKFIEVLFAQSSMPAEYRLVVKKATHKNPEKRYQTPEAMLSAIRQKRGVKNSMLVGLVALAVALAGVWVYVQMVPEPEEIEFVQPAPDAKADDPFSDDYDPSEDPYEELLLGGDSVTEDVGEMSRAEKERQMKEYEAKAEQIFRKQFTKEADRILSKIYNTEYMNSSEKKFMAASQGTMEELVKVQSELASKTHLSDERTSRIASEVIEMLSAEKKKKLQYNGIQKEKNEDKKK